MIQIRYNVMTTREENKTRKRNEEYLVGLEVLGAVVSNRMLGEVFTEEMLPELPPEGEVGEVVSNASQGY